MIVIYEKNTRRVCATEIDGKWTLPANLEIKEFPVDAEIFIGKSGKVFLKPSALN